ncbi:MAG: hypothetical protein J7J98_06225 [candidate division Zixibacteria bacterium]|nr:hypothetical protein [candidate division Zixibacteria bacterium]
MFEFLNLEQLATIQVLLTLVGSLTIIYVCFRIVSWLIKQIAVLFKWTIRVVIATALSRFLLELVSAKLNFSETIRTMIF